MQAALISVVVGEKSRRMNRRNRRKKPYSVVTKLENLSV